MKIYTAILLLICAGASKADFSGPFALTPPAPGSYSQILDASYGGWHLGVGSGIAVVDTTLAPSTLRLYLNGFRTEALDFEILVATQDWNISFDYRVNGLNLGSFSWFHGGSETIVPGLVTTSTAGSMMVQSGERFGFKVRALGTIMFPGSLAVRDVTIGNFSFTSVPEPGTVALMLLGAVAWFGVKWGMTSTRSGGPRV